MSGRGRVLSGRAEVIDVFKGFSERNFRRIGIIAECASSALGCRGFGNGGAFTGRGAADDGGCRSKERGGVAKRGHCKLQRGRDAVVRMLYLFGGRVEGLIYCLIGTGEIKGSKSGGCLRAVTKHRIRGGEA